MEFKIDGLDHYRRVIVLANEGDGAVTLNLGTEGHSMDARLTRDQALALADGLSAVARILDDEED